MSESYKGGAVKAINSFFDGDPCPDCRASLKVTSFDHQPEFHLDGQVYAHSYYICSGANRHRYAELIPLLGVKPRGIKLVAKPPKVRPNMIEEPLLELSFRFPAPFDPEFGTPTELLRLNPELDLLVGMDEFLRLCDLPSGETLDLGDGRFILRNIGE